MTLHAEIAELKVRLARAESERDTWRASGRQENYLEAYSKVDALIMQLAQLERTERERLMRELCISFNGRSYAYSGYRYDRLADAANYARLDRSRAFVDPVSDDPGPLEVVHAPSDVERDLMRRLAITFENGVFRWRDYRYDRLADAVDYARSGSAT
jgi:hypothetical protein